MLSFFGSPMGTRTPDSAVRGRRLNHLTMRPKLLTRTKSPCQSINILNIPTCRYTYCSYLQLSRWVSLILLLPTNQKSGSLTSTKAIENPVHIMKVEQYKQHAHLRINSCNYYIIFFVRCKYNLYYL